MKSVSKVIGLLLVAILILLIGAGFTITQIFDPNDYKSEIQQLVKDKADLELKLNGDIGWSLFPWLGLEVTDVEVAQLERSDEPFAKVRLLGLSVRVMPLLRKELQMSDIRIDGLNLNLHTDSKGRSNWEPASKQQKSSTQTPSQPEESKSEQSAGAPLKLDIDSLIVNSARIEYRDEQNQQHLTLENVQITTGTIREGADIPIKLSGFIANAEPLIRARLEMTVNANLDLQLQRYQLNDLKLSSELAGEQLAGKTLNLSARGNLLLDQSAQIASWKQIRLGLNQLKLSGDITASQLNSQAKLDGNLNIAQVNLREFMQGLGIELPETANNKALSRFELSSQLSGTDNSIKLEQLNMQLDQTTFGGTIGSSNLAKSAFFADLKGDQLNLDDYLAPESKETNNKSASSGSGGNVDAPLPSNPEQNPWATEALLPLEQLRALNLDIKLGMQQITTNNLPLENLQVKMTAKDGVINLSQAQVKLYSGTINNSLVLNAKTETPELKISSNIQNVPVDKLLTALQQEQLLEGSINFKADLNTKGNSERALVGNLNGTSNFAINNGRLTSINVDKYLCSAVATLNRKSMTQEFKAQHTDFNDLSGSIKFTNGQADNRDLKIALPGLEVKGKGGVNLNVMGLDYKAGITLLGDSREMPDPACSINKRYVGLELPVRCRGPIMNDTPSCQLDQDGLGKVAGKLAGEKLTEKLDEKLGEKVSPELKDALKDLFKR